MRVAAQMQVKPMSKSVTLPYSHSHRRISPLALAALISASTASNVAAFNQDGFYSYMTPAEVSVILSNSKHALVGPINVGPYIWYHSSEDDHIRFYFCHNKLISYNKPLIDFMQAVQFISESTATYGQGSHDQDFVHKSDLAMASIRMSWRDGIDTFSVNVAESSTPIHSTQQFQGAGYNLAGSHVVPSYDVSWTSKSNCP